MPGVQLQIPDLGSKFQDYRDDIPGDSYNWGPVIDPKAIRYFAIHHSVTPQTAKNDGDWKAECDTIANEHLAQGWGGVGYRFIICSDGTVAYVGDLSHGGSAVAGNNDIIFSACLVGDFTKQLPTAEQVHSAHILANFFLTKLPQYPNLESWDQVIGHQDAAGLLGLPGATPTACPGSNWRTQGDNLRDRIINDRYQGYPDPQPPASTVASPQLPKTPAPPVAPTPADPPHQDIHPTVNPVTTTTNTSPTPPNTPAQPVTPPSPKNVTPALTKGQQIDLILEGPGSTLSKFWKCLGVLFS